MTIGEWIDRSGRPVPGPLRTLLDAGGTVSGEALLQAAQQKASIGGTGVPRSRVAAFSLLGADSYITYACLWAVRHSGSSQDLRRMTSRVAGSAWRE